MSKRSRFDNRTAILLAVAILLFALFQFFRASTTSPGAENRTPASPTMGALRTPLASAADAITVRFSDPFSALAGQRTGGPDAPLAQAIGAAQANVDVAIYNLSLPSIITALIEAHERGVAVRMVTDSSAMNESTRLEIEEAGIPVVGDAREGLMHNKFIVIDGQEVWTGSLNLTAPAAYNDNNNLIRLLDVRVAASYAKEFEEMFTGGQFGPTSTADTPYRQVEVAGTPVEIYFSPEDDPIDRIVPLVAGAQESVHFLAYSFTADELFDAMLERFRRGVEVRGVMEAQQVESNVGTEYPRLVDAGVPVRLDGITGLMHHKVIIIDGEIVITGSYNFSRAAEETNDENVLILFNPDLAAQYEAEFERVYSQGQ
ncbi:MAG TPA: phospholipase D-like domain-containing protein [Anaerolineaceae bacterium]|nr:phospholipase D-like domain-containing protein [Anaerolineaceae bacterium]